MGQSAPTGNVLLDPWRDVTVFHADSETGVVAEPGTEKAQGRAGRPMEQSGAPPFR